MSQRRLADDILQPQRFAFSRENAAWAKAKIKEYPAGRQQSAVIPVLWKAQEQEGWVSRPAIEAVAELLGMPYIRVLEVATFYTQFQLQPVGSMAHVQVCGTTPCMLRGAESLRAVCQRLIHPDPHHLNASGSLSWEEVECMGACVNAPMVAIGYDTYEDLTPARLEQIIAAFEAGRGSEVPTGPQNGRKFSAPATGPTTLTEVPDRRPAPAERGAGAADQAPTQPGRMREVPIESAPGVRGPGGKKGKVTQEVAEAARAKFDAAAGADGSPNSAGRPGAVGGESPGGTLDDGAAVGELTPLFEAPGGVPDDLKLISGVGPVIEGKLHALGVIKWAQVAAFTAEDIAKLDQALSFRGRIVRDDWVRQAEALAKGGADEYRRVFGKDPR